MSTFNSAVRDFMADEQGVTAIEYGMIAALIAGVIIVAVRAVGVKTFTNFVAANTGWGE